MVCLDPLSPSPDPSPQSSLSPFTPSLLLRRHPFQLSAAYPCTPTPSTPTPHTSHLGAAAMWRRAQLEEAGVQRAAGSTRQVEEEGHVVARVGTGVACKAGHVGVQGCVTIHWRCVRVVHSWCVAGCRGCGCCNSSSSVSSCSYPFSCRVCRVTGCERWWWCAAAR